MENDNYIETNLKEEKKDKVNQEIMNLEENNNSEDEKEILKNIPEFEFEEEKIEIPQYIINIQNNEEKFSKKIINKTRKNKEININEFFNKNKHYLIMTEGGKPIYSRYGDAIDNSAFFAALSAIITKFTIFNSTEDKKEELNIISNSKKLIVFDKKNSLIFVSISNKNEYVSLLKSQLEYLNNQLMSILTNDFYKKLKDNPSRYLSIINKNEILFENMIYYTSHSFVSLFNSFQVFKCDFREKLNKICEENIGSARIMIIMTSYEIISLSHHPDIKINSSDIILLQNLILSNESLKTIESWVPICLPGISEEGYLQLYCKFDDYGIGICFLTENIDSKYFMEFIEQYRKIYKILIKENLIEKIIELYPKKILEDKNEINDDELINKLVDKIILSNNNRVNQKILRPSNDLLRRSNVSTKNSPQIRQRIMTNFSKNSIFAKNDIFDDVICGICNNKQYSQYFLIKINQDFRNLNKIEKNLLKEYNKLYDKLYLYPYKDNFFTIEKGNIYINAIYQNETFILICSFNFFLDYDDVIQKMKDILKQIKKDENKYFILYK